MFSDLAYIYLLIVVVALYWFVKPIYRQVVLSLSGIAFYAFYAGSNVFLLLLLTIGSWYALFGRSRTEETASAEAEALSRRIALISIPIFVLVLIYYKYGSFVQQILGATHTGKSLAPLAISFFTFEFVHVAAEKYKGTIRKVGFFEYLAFIFFFPTMIAGPIKRYGQFHESLIAAEPQPNNFLEGLFRILLGLFKKLVLADNLNTLIAEIGTPQKTHNVVLLTGAVILYGFRILLDFAGYSDIAIGSALLFGLKVPENFLFPYRQTNISNFWRHWHISLNTWLTDYVYFPLGGSRQGFYRTLLNVTIVMLISGLWHGAAWNFILWGAWHGAMLVILRVYTERVKPHISKEWTDSAASKAVSYALTMVGVWIGWMFFMWPMNSISMYLRLLVAKL